ncbi:MAG TPA: MBL fold metallo-hydrolase [Candidatus Dormibacteraeota bacterium]
MPAWICATCANQTAEAAEPPPVCRICADERQYIGRGGQRWTTLDELRDEGRESDIREVEPGLIGIGVRPSFGIGQRTLVVATASGQVLWDPTGYIDDAAVAAVRARGPLLAVTASHPHFYGVAVEWAHAFPEAEVLIPDADAQWLMRPDAAVRHWRGELEVTPGVRLVQCGGHFAGSAVLHWAAGAEGRGVLLTGDTLPVVADRRYVSFMRSYPNYIPLPAAAIRRIVERVSALTFDRIYDGWWTSVLDSRAQDAVRRSAERYARWVSGDEDPDI